MNILLHILLHILLIILLPEMAAAGSRADTFPHIETTIRNEWLDWVATYSKEMGIAPLQPNHARLFVQPKGFMGNIVDVDLGMGWWTMYSSSNARPNGKPNPKRGKKPASSLKPLVILLQSNDFQKLPSESTKAGLDGCTYLLEVDQGEIYQWKLYWEPDNQTLKEIIRLLEALPSRDETDAAPPATPAEDLR